MKYQLHNDEHIGGILVARSNNEEWGVTVATRISPEWKEILEKHVIGWKHEFKNFSEYLRHLIRKDMKERGFL